MRLSQKGKILEVVTDIDAELGRCMTKESRGSSYPKHHARISGLR